MSDPVDYSIVARKKPPEETVDNLVLHLPVEFLAGSKNGKLIINPIYRIISRSGEGIHIWRKRENEKWELEALLMMKAMPLHILLQTHILEDARKNIISAEVLSLLQRGVLIEVPKFFT